MTGLPAFIGPAKTKLHFPRQFPTLEVQSLNLNACLALLNFILVASVITTEFVTLTVTVFVKKPLKRDSRSPFPAELKFIFGRLPVSQNNFQKRSARGGFVPRAGGKPACGVRALLNSDA